MRFDFLGSTGLALVFLFALAVVGLVWLSSCARATSGRVSSGAGPCPVHVGARPASDGFGGYAGTVQVSLDTPVLGSACGR